VAAAGAQVAAQAEKSVAVLYFEHLGGSKEDEYFRDSWFHFQIGGIYL
jgi:TolB-like protein